MCFSAIPLLYLCFMYSVFSVICLSWFCSLRAMVDRALKCLVNTDVFAPHPGRNNMVKTR